MKSIILQSLGHRFQSSYDLINRRSLSSFTWMLRRSSESILPYDYPFVMIDLVISIFVLTRISSFIPWRCCRSFLGFRRRNIQFGSADSIGILIVVHSRRQMWSIRRISNKEFFMVNVVRIVGLKEISNG
jgi:hypothetical protein